LCRRKLVELPHKRANNFEEGRAICRHGNRPCPMFRRNKDFGLKLPAQSNDNIIHRLRILHGDCSNISAVDAFPNDTTITTKHFRRDTGCNFSLIADTDSRRAPSKCGATSFG
jgi:hypothetical protein